VEMSRVWHAYRTCRRQAHSADWRGVSVRGVPCRIAVRRPEASTRADTRAIIGTLMEGHSCRGGLARRTTAARTTSEKPSRRGVRRFYLFRRGRPRRGAAGSLSDGTPGSSFRRAIRRRSMGGGMLRVRRGLLERRSSAMTPRAPGKSSAMSLAQLSISNVTVLHRF